MRKALVGIAAAPMLATLVIAIVPAFAAVRLKFCDKTGIYCMYLTPIDNQFFLWRVGDQLPLCHGIGAHFVKDAVSVHGECIVSNVGASFLTGGGKVSTGPIRLALVTLSVPPTKPLILALWPV